MQGMSPEQLAAVSQQQFTPGQAASPADLARTADMLQVTRLACCMIQQGVQTSQHSAAMHACPRLCTAHASELCPVLQLYRAATLGCAKPRSGK